MISKNKNTNSSHSAAVIVHRLSTYRSVCSQLHSKKEVGSRFSTTKWQKTPQISPMPPRCPGNTNAVEAGGEAHAFRSPRCKRFVRWCLLVRLCERHASSFVAAGLMLWCLPCCRAQRAVSPIHFHMWLLICAFSAS